MHLRFFLIGFFLLLPFSCKPGTSERVLSPDKMSAIITDLQLADAAYKLDMLPPEYKNHPEKYYLEILASHQTDSASYNKSMRYYAENPALLKKIYMDVEKNLQQKNTRK